jgi:hypothetical protein
MTSGKMELFLILFPHRQTTTLKLTIVSESLTLLTQDRDVIKG